VDERRLAPRTAVHASPPSLGSRSAAHGLPLALLLLRLQRLVLLAEGDCLAGELCVEAAAARALWSRATKSIEPSLSLR